MMHLRLERLTTRLQELKLDGLLVSSLPNIRYLFGFTGSNALALVTPDRSFLVTDRRYDQQSRHEVSHAEIIIAQRDLLAEVPRLPIGSQLVSLGIEANHLNVRDFFYLKKKIPDWKLIASERVVERIASVKSADEIDYITRAAKICCTVFEQVTALIQPGVSELEISAEISYRTMRAGSEKDPFEPIVASGLRSALPHGVSSAKKIQAGDLVILDFGATINGYAADFTRTVIVGEPSAAQIEIADVVLTALEQSEAAARPGLTGRQLDAIARAAIAEGGFASYFQHSLGHGLGLNVHELPRIGERSDDPLEIGNVITLEPGIYLPEVGGVRIEDDFVLTKTGLQNLTPVSRELRSVG